MNPSDDSNRYAPPQTHVADIKPSGSVELASRGARLGAAMIDILVLVLLIAIVSLVTPWKPFEPPTPDKLLASKVVGALITLLLFLAVNGYLLAKSGQTVGKKMLGLRIVRPDGARASPVRVIGARYLVLWAVELVPYLGVLISLIDALLVFRTSRRCLHDDIADTIVIKL